MNSGGFCFVKEKIEMPTLLSTDSDQEGTSITIDLGSSKESDISSQNRNLYVNTYIIPCDFSRPQSTMSYYPIEEIVITNTLGKQKLYREDSHDSSYRSLSRFPGTRQRNADSASSDSELHRKVPGVEERFSDLSLQNIPTSKLSTDTIKNMNTGADSGRRTHVRNISSVHSIASQPKQYRDSQIFWRALACLILFAWWSRILYSLRNNDQ